MVARIVRQHDADMFDRVVRHAIQHVE